MDRNELVSILKALIYVATADEEISVDEEQYFFQIGNVYGLTSEEIEDLKSTVLQKKETLPQILSNIHTRKNKVSLLFHLLSLCYADGEYSEYEKNALLQVCELLGLENQKLIDLEEVMEENLALQKKIALILEG